MNYDVIVIGAGPGGYVAAIRASQLGMKTAVIEKEKLGGVCLNIGCIPSKALIQKANEFTDIKKFKEFGINIDYSGFNYEKIWEKSRKAAEKLSEGVKYLLTKNKVDIISGYAQFTDKNTVSVNGEKYTAKNIIIATGSRPREIDMFKFDEENILSSTGVLMMKKIPESIIIVGSGAIGTEFAHILNAFGTKVYITEVMDRILPSEDEESVKILKESFRKRDIEMMTSAEITEYKKEGKNYYVGIKNKKDESIKTIQAEKILIAAGRIPNTEGINLEKIGVETEKGYIKTDKYYRTNISGIYAIGDIVRTPQLAHVASKEGEIAVLNIKNGPKNTLDNMLIPSAIYCEPEIASFGMTEKMLRENKRDYIKSDFPYYGAGKTVATEKSEGNVKIFADRKTHEILGAVIVGYNATEIIHEIILAAKAELLPEDIAEMIHAHPTVSEAVMEAMRGLEGWAVHI